jgi:hypothetical protein
MTAPVEADGAIDSGAMDSGAIECGAMEAGAAEVAALGAVLELAPELHAATRTTVPRASAKRRSIGMVGLLFSGEGTGHRVQEPGWD